MGRKKGIFKKSGKFFKKAKKIAKTATKIAKVAGPIITEVGVMTGQPELIAAGEGVTEVAQLSGKALKTVDKLQSAIENRDANAIIDIAGDVAVQTGHLDQKEADKYTKAGKQVADVAKLLKVIPEKKAEHLEDAMETVAESGPTTPDETPKTAPTPEAGAPAKSKSKLPSIPEGLDEDEKNDAGAIMNVLKSRSDNDDEMDDIRDKLLQLLTQIN